MTLREFLNLGILRDNVIIYEFVSDAVGLGDLQFRFNKTRCSTVVRPEYLKDLDNKYFKYELIEMWPAYQKGKTALVIRAPKSTALTKDETLNWLAKDGDIYNVSIEEIKTGKIGVAHTNPRTGLVNVFYGEDDGSDDCIISTDEFLERFIITLVEKYDVISDKYIIVYEK